jgi:hypothetical protein
MEQEDSRSEGSAVNKMSKLDVQAQGKLGAQILERTGERSGKSGPPSRKIESVTEGRMADSKGKNGEVKPLSSVRPKKPVQKPEISEQIGRQLRNLYNDVLAQPVPDRLIDLLRTLETKENEKGGK